MTPDKELDITIYEDILHLSRLWSTSDTKNSDIRNSVHILRRLLIYGDLQNSVNSRKYPLLIDAPDLKPFIKATNYGLVEFYQAGGANVLGVYVSGTMVSKGTSNRLPRIMREHHPDATVKLNIRSFLRQSCFSFRGQFVSREDVIKYVANKAGSAHYDRKGRDIIIDKIRAVNQICLADDGIPSFGFKIDAFEKNNFSFDPNPKNIDPVFIEVAATAKYLTESTSIKAYCDLLKNEYKLEFPQKIITTWRSRDEGYKPVAHILQSHSKDVPVILPAGLKRDSNFGHTTTSAAPAGSSPGRWH